MLDNPVGPGDSGQMLIAEDIALLAHDDETGRDEGTVPMLDHRLAGAVVAELTLAGKVVMTEEKRPKAEVVDPAPTGDPVLDHALTFIAEKPRTGTDLLPRLASGITERVLTRLTDRGILRREKGKVLGLFPVTRWPAEDSSHETLLRARLERVLLSGEQPDARTATLIAVLDGTTLVSRLVPKERRREARERAKEIASQDWASTEMTQAMAAAVRAAQDSAAMIAAMVVTTAAISSS